MVTGTIIPVMSRQKAAEYREGSSENVSPDSAKRTSERVVELLNEASITTSDSDKVKKLLQVQELIVNKEPALLDNFTDEVLAFQADRSHDVRKFVIGFMEEASKKDNELLTKVITNLNLLVADRNAGVIKKMVQSMTQLFRIVVNWLSKGKSVSNSQKACWKVTCDIRDHIFELLDSDNDGIRTQCVKFAEKVVLTLSEVQRSSEVTEKSAATSALSEISSQHELLKCEDLKADGEKALQRLLAFVSYPAISSVNLMAAMGTLTAIARQRSQFMGTVVQAFEALHANLPPTLAKTQVASVRKHLKLQLINMLRLLSSMQYHPQITNLLYDLGTTSSEIAKNMPKLSQQVTSRKKIQEDKSSDTKKEIKAMEDSDEDEIGSSSAAVRSTSSDPPIVVNQQNMAIDITAQELVPLLTPENVANLVLLSMVMLPDKMPDAFQASYTPIESAGTEDQVGHLARLLSIQMTAMGVGPGIQKAAELATLEDTKKKEKKLEEEGRQSRNQKLQIQTVIGGTTKTLVNEEEVKDKESKKDIEAVISSQTVAPRHGMHRRIQGFKLETITTPLSLEDKDKTIRHAVLRVLNSEEKAIIGGFHAQWEKILPSLVAQFGGDLHRALAKFVLEDIRNRSCLAFSWLYEEFNIYLETSKGSDDKSAQENYDACLTGLMQGFREKPETRDELFARLVMQAPLLTDGSMRQIKLYCEDEKRSHSGIKLVKKLLFIRPTRQTQFLRILLDLCASQKVLIQTEAVDNIKDIYQHEELQEYICTYAIVHLQYLSQSSPPANLLQADTVAEKDPKWTEIQMKQCVTLFLALLPLNHNLVKILAEVYVQANADIKRVILRALDNPVSQMGMESPQLLHLVEGCPKGAETLVTRMLHILTDKCDPSAELVQRVRDLYVKRVPDVRFLIPVLNGLEKHEVVKALPKLVQLNPPVVKGVFNRLLGVNRNHDLEPSMNALSPVELLIALHDIDTGVVDVKCVIKATSFCFAQKAVYTSEVLVTVINRLLDQVPMPTLVMRTVIQSLITYPRLSGFVMNILQRLIAKKVWGNDKVWEGFIKCCQRLKPQSFQVLLQLPSAQLTSVFSSAPELRESMMVYAERFTPQQKQHIDKEILVLLEQKPIQTNAGNTQAFGGYMNTEHSLAAVEQRVRLEQQRHAEEQARLHLVKSEVRDADADEELVNFGQENKKGSGAIEKIKKETDNDKDQTSSSGELPGSSSDTRQHSTSDSLKVTSAKTSHQGLKRRSPTPTLDETPERKAPRMDDD